MFSKALRHFFVLCFCRFYALLHIGGDDMKNKPPHPDRYFYVSLICLILLFLNFYRTDNWTGDKPFSEFVGQDWQLFAIFLIEEFIIICVMVVFWLLGQKSIKKQREFSMQQSFTSSVDLWFYGSGYTISSILDHHYHHLEYC